MTKKVGPKPFIYYFSILICLCAVKITHSQIPAKDSVKTSAIALNNKAVALLSFKKQDKNDLIVANKILDSAIKISPKYKLAYINKVNNLKKLKRYKEAIEADGALGSLFPNDPTIMVDKALLLEKINNQTEAYKNYKKAAKILGQRYLKDHSLANLMNLASTRYLLYNNIDSARSIFNKEKYRYKDSSVVTRKNLEVFENTTLPNLPVLLK